MAKTNKNNPKSAPPPEKKGSSLSILVVLAILIGIGVFAFTREKDQPSEPGQTAQNAPIEQPQQSTEPPAQQQPPQQAPSYTPDSSTMAPPADNFRVPPYFQTADQAGELKATLDPAAVEVYAREGYEVAKRKPKLLTQLPCFCYCDRFGHTSLHTCFETDHAVHCDICLKEAIEADRMDKEGKSPEEIRNVIIEQYRRGGGSHEGHTHS